MNRSILLATLIAIAIGFTTINSSQYKCLIKMKTYSGEGAYIAISLIDTIGNYNKTLYVQGNDDEWYYEINEWWKFQGTVRENLDSYSGETISSGNSTITILTIPDNKINKGYKIRFETAVEDEGYYIKDVEFELTSENLKNKIKGKGFIDFIQIAPKK